MKGAATAKRVHISTACAFVAVAVLLLVPVALWAESLRLLAGLLGLGELPALGDEGGGHLDKLVHFVLFFAIAAQTDRSWRAVGRSSSWAAPAVGASYGVALEVLQGLTGRTTDIWDGVANVLGALAFVGWRCLLARRGPEP